MDKGRKVSSKQSVSSFDSSYSHRFMSLFSVVCILRKVSPCSVFPWSRVGKWLVMGHFQGDT